MIPARINNQGFSLIELSLLLALMGLVVGTVLEQYSSYLHTKIANDTAAHQTSVSQALARFVYDYGRLPCPADPSLPPIAAKAGIENCLSNPAVGYCEGAVCRANGFRDTKDDADFSPDPILRGGLPYISLGVTLQDALDGWGNQVSYTVTQYLTVAGTGSVNSGTYNDQFGSINVQQLDRSANTLINTFDAAVGPDPGTKGGYMFAVVSHGPDGRGAYNANGVLVAPCGTTARDAENCDGDATFLDPGSDVNSGAYSLVAGPAYYDDAFVFDQLVMDNDKWAIAGGGIGRIFNKTGARVGIGTAAPDYALDVSGNARVKNYLANNVCNDGSSNCFPPSIFGGTVGTDCNGGVLLGVQSGKPICQSSVNLSAITALTCAAGTYIKGIDASGVPICGP